MGARGVGGKEGLGHKSKVLGADDIWNTAYERFYHLFYTGFTVPTPADRTPLSLDAEDMGVRKIMSNTAQEEWQMLAKFPKT